MNYEVTRAMNTNVTYGWLITRGIPGESAYQPGLKGGIRGALINGEHVTIGAIS